MKSLADIAVEHALAALSHARYYPDPHDTFETYLAWAKQDSVPEDDRELEEIFWDTIRQQLQSKRKVV